jgi:RHS repeat-associated protein
VDFFQGTTPIGTASSAPYAFNWTNVAQGSYALTAVATDNDGAVITSAAVNVTVNSGVAQVYYIVPDHLNTTRLIQDQAGNTVWRWDQGEPFGNDVPNNNPSGAGAFDFPLRFPGQYFDRETNLNYNYFRDYDPTIGRYVESDPIGLDGGADTYAYVRLSPNRYADRSGLLEINPADFPVAERDPYPSYTGTLSCPEEACGIDPATAAEIIIGIAGIYPATRVIARAATACYKVVKQDPCKIPILAAALGASICASTLETQTGQRPQGKPPGSARQYSVDRTRLQELKDASERATQTTAAGSSSVP